MSDRITSVDAGYQTGDLSVYPHAIDNTDTLYEVRNGAITSLKQGLPFSGNYIVVNDTSAFPEKGILRIGPLASHISIQKTDVFPNKIPGTPGTAELVYYGEKTSNSFKKIIRGYAGSIRTEWPSGTQVGNSVVAEIHNSIKDAVINIERYVGKKIDPEAGSINYTLKTLEAKFLAPKALFRAYPRSGAPSLKVRFQNFSNTNVYRSLWDFGDYTTSTDTNPIHVYKKEGIYTVSLNIITSTGSHGITTKNNYITVSNAEDTAYFYITLDNPDEPYSENTAQTLGKDPAVITFVDQTKGLIEQRIWSFGDGETLVVDDPNIHVVKHTYVEPSPLNNPYKPMLIVVFSEQSYKKIYSKEITII